MALLYRGIWQDDRGGLIADALDAFGEWAESKTETSLQLGTDGSATGPGWEVYLVRGEGEAGSIVRATLHEERTDERWTTQLLAMSDAASGDGWVWIDVERVAADPFERFQIAAPRLARELIETGTRPRRGSVGLTVRPRAYRPTEAPELAGLLRDPARDLPIVAFSHDERLEAEEWVGRCEDAARILAGVATVGLLPPPTVEAFKEEVGEELAVWDGALRVYLPGISAAEPRPWRHRYLTPAQIDGPRHRAGMVVGQMLAPFVSGRRAPACFIRLRPLLSRRSGLDLEGLESLLIEEEERSKKLAYDVERLTEDNFELLAELELVQEQNNLLAQALVTIQVDRGERSQDALEIPAEAKTVGHAAELAQRYLDRIVVPDGALRELDRLADTPESRQWGMKAWQGLRALDAYAEEAAEFNGGFFEWCKHTSSPWTWPATSKKLAMRESETVVQNDRMRSSRVFPVSTDVDGSGELLMEAHLKIAEGGGNLAPRIYFHDDTKGVTGKVHVGFIGPHFLVPNTRA